MMSFRPLLFSIFCFAGPCLATVRDPGREPGVSLPDCDSIVAHVCSYLEFPLHAIFDTLVPGGRPQSIYDDGEDEYENQGSSRKPNRIRHLEEHSWKPFYQLLLHPVELRRASRLFRNVAPPRGFATQLLSYVEPGAVLRATTERSRSMETSNDVETGGSNAGVAAASPPLDDSFRHFLHLLEKALVREPLRATSAVYPESAPFGTLVRIYLLGERHISYSAFVVETGGVELSDADKDKLGGVWFDEVEKQVFLPQAPSLIVCGTIFREDRNGWTLTLKVESIE